MIAIEDIDNVLMNSLAFLDNNRTVAIIAALLILYSAFVADRLPPLISRLFNRPLIKLPLFILIAYIARKNAALAIIVAIGVLVSILSVNKEGMSDVPFADFFDRCKCGQKNCGCRLAPDINLPQMPDANDIAAYTPKEYAPFEAIPPLVEIQEAKPEESSAETKAEGFSVDNLELLNCTGRNSQETVNAYDPLMSSVQAL